MSYIYSMRHVHSKTGIDMLRPRQNGRHFPDYISKWIFLNENVWILVKSSLQFLPQCPIYNIPVLVQIMAWHRSGDKPLSGPMLVCLPTQSWAKFMHFYSRKCIWNLWNGGHFSGPQCVNTLCVRHCSIFCNTLVKAHKIFMAISTP